MIAFLRNNIPNLLTCLNLCCGLVGLVLLSEKGADALPDLCMLLIIAGIADFLDGFAARLLGSASAIGKDLDSLADAVTFGVLPSLAGYLLLSSMGAGIWSWMSLSTAVFSVIRLARFNNDPGQSDSFIGVPTPANAFFLIFLYEGIFSGHGSISGFEFEFTLLTAIIASTSWLLVSPFKIIALKFKGTAWNENKDKFILAAIGFILIASLGKESVPLLFLLYIGISFVSEFLKRNKKQ